MRRLWCQHGQDHSARQARGDSLLQDQGAALQGWVRILSPPQHIRHKKEKPNYVYKMPVPGSTFNTAHSLLYTGSIQESKNEHSMHGGNPCWAACSNTWLRIEMMPKAVVFFLFVFYLSWRQPTANFQRQHVSRNQHVRLQPGPACQCQLASRNQHAWSHPT